MEDLGACGGVTICQLGSFPLRMGLKGAGS